MAIVQSIIFILGVSGIKFLTTKTATMTFDPFMTLTSGIIKKEVELRKFYCVICVSKRNQRVQSSSKSIEHQSRSHQSQQYIFVKSLPGRPNVSLMCPVCRNHASNSQKDWAHWTLDQAKFGPGRFVNPCKRGWTFGLTVCRITTAVDNAYQVQ